MLREKVAFPSPTTGELLGERRSIPESFAEDAMLPKLGRWDRERTEQGPSSSGAMVRLAMRDMNDRDLAGEKIGLSV